MKIEEKSTHRETGRKFALDLPSWLATLYAPILPLLKNIKIKREGPRGYNPRDILLPEGYVAEVVATGLNAPVHCTFDGEGACYVAESGHKIDSPPRIIKIDPQTGRQEVYYEVPEERWVLSGALTGVTWYSGYLYVMNTDTLLRIRPGGMIEELLTDLPGKGDHQANYPVVGPDGKLYYGQGCATNAGVVGADDYAFEWLPKYPDFHDLPAQDLTLTGRNFEYQNVLEDVTETVRSGAYSPFGVPTTPGQVIPASERPTGAIMRCNLDGSDLEVFASGLRNPYGLAFDAQGRLFITEHGMDERGKRFIVDDPDDFYEVKQGQWYGWPDYASGVRLDDPRWGEGGANREPLIENPPDPNPPRPLAEFDTHVAANGVDICKDPAFGFEGQAFVACFGDLAPITTLTRAVTPMGFKVVRVDPQSGAITDFAVNRIVGPASKLPHEGFERPSHCQFGPDGALYVVDFGEIEIAPEKGGIRMQKGTGTLWRIRRTGGPRGQIPPAPVQVPLYLLQGLALVGGLVGGVLLLRWLFRRLRRG
jgi:glucose/arabinose dehydrogenase